MKKLFIRSALLLGALFTIAACGGSDDESSSVTSSITSGETSEATSQEESTSSELPVGSDVTIYLALGEIGLYNGKKGQDYPDVFVENAIKLETKVGDVLPGSSVITSTSKATFQGWVKYDGKGALTKYEKAPGVNNAILYANFVA